MGRSGPGFPLRSRRRRGGGRPVAGGRRGLSRGTSAGRCGRVSPAAREPGRPVAGGTHGGSPLAAKRCAGCGPALDRRPPARHSGKGLGGQMIADIAADARQAMTILSVSFGYTRRQPAGASGNAAGLPSCGWAPIAEWPARRASCYGDGLLFPLTAAWASAGAARSAQRLQRDELPAAPVAQSVRAAAGVSDAMLSDEDWLEAASFFAHPAGRGAGLPQPPADAGRHAVAGPARTSAGKRPNSAPCCS